MFSIHRNKMVWAAIGGEKKRKKANYTTNCQQDHDDKK